MTTQVAILVSGGGSNMVALARSMTGNHPARPVLVLSNDPQAGGLVRAAEMGIATAAVDHRPFKGDRPGFEAELVKPILESGADLICQAGFMRVLTPAFVTRFAGRMLNIHPSLLPKYPGLHTHRRALEAGDTEAGCTVHEVIPDLDAGPILGQARVAIAPDDTAETLAARVLVKEHQLYPAVMRRFVEGERSFLAL